jgi:hypothetical protein
MVSSLHSCETYARDDATRRTAPLQHVDYFSEEWTEDDISSSWKLVVSQRGVCAKNTRLENASWRLWTKTRQRLHTMPPERIQWLKANDTARLYGPLESKIAKLPLSPIITDGVLMRTILKRSKSDIVLLGNAYTPCPGTITSSSAGLDGGGYCRVAIINVPLDSMANMDSTRHIQFNEQVEQRMIISNRSQVFDQVSHKTSLSYHNLCTSKPQPFV